MNIFDPLITGSLSVSGSGEISGDLTVLGTINATISGTTSNAITASEAPKYTLTSSFDNFTGSYTTGSFTGSFIGDGGDLYNIPASGVTGLNLAQIADGNVTASVSNENGLRVNSKSEITGSLIVTEGITGSIDYSNITNKPTLVSGSSQIDITGTTGYSTFSSSISSSVGSLSSSIATTNLNQDDRLSSLETASGSIRTDFTTYTSSNNTVIGTLQTATSSLNTFTSSTSVRLSSIETSTGSLNVFSSSTNTRIGSIETYTGSNNTTNTTQNSRLTSLEGKSGSYATTGSNNFIGTQTITGSLYISQNLIVQGSSSLENITASAVSIGTNTIILNTDTPAFRYAGISVFDSGSTNVTASLFYDSLTNQWKFQHTDTGTNDASIVLFGPLGNNIDNAPLLDGNYITKVENNGHGHHLTTSSILDNGSKVSINSNSEITGSLTVTGVIKSTTTPLVSGSSQVSFNGITDKPTLVSGSSQISHDSTTGYVANRHIDHTVVSITAGNGLSGGGNISATRTVTLDTGSVHFLDGVKKELNTEGVISGSSQVLNGTTIHSGAFFNGISVVSGSAQISFNGITDKPTLVSGSSQITYGSLTGIPSGIVSGSVQVKSLLPSGTVSGSVQVKSLLPSGTVSGSSQVTGIANSQLTNSSFHVGTTSISLGRTSASQTLTGVSIGGNAATASRVVSGNSNPASTSFNNTLTPAVSSNRVLNFDGNGNTPSVWWTNGSRAYGAIDAQDPGLTFWANNGTNWQQQANLTYGNFNINTTFSTSGQSTFGGSLTVNVSTTPIVLQTSGANRGWIYSDSGGVGINQGGTTWRNLVYCTADYIRFHTAGGARWDVDASGHFVPVTNNAFNIGSTSNRVANLYTNDLHLSNEGRVDGNEIDGTTGDWTIQEGAENLYIINNKNGKKFKIDLTEIK
jgi:hypothetical protein